MNTKNYNFITLISLLFIVQLFASQKTYLPFGIDPEKPLTVLNPHNQIILQGEDGHIIQKQFSPLELNDFARRNNGYSIIAMIPYKEPNRPPLITSLLSYETNDDLNLPESHYLCSFTDHNNLFQLHDVTSNMLFFLNLPNSSPFELGRNFFNGNEQIITASGINLILNPRPPIFIPLRPVAIIDTYRAINQFTKKIAHTLAQQFNHEKAFIREAAFNEGFIAGRTLSQESIPSPLEISTIPAINLNQPNNQKTPEEIQVPIAQEENDAKEDKQEITAEEKAARNKAKKERLKEEKRIKKITNYGIEKAQSFFADGKNYALKLLLNLKKQNQVQELNKEDSSTSMIQDPIPTVQESVIIKDDKKKKKKKKKNKKTQLLNSDDNNDDDTEDYLEELLSETLSDEQILELMPSITHYEQITTPVKGILKINPKNLETCFLSASYFFNHAKEKNDPKIINFLNTTLLQALKQHTAMLHPDRQPIPFVFSAGILYSLNLLRMLNKEKETLPITTVVPYIQNLLHYTFIKDIFDYYKEEYSDSLELNIKTEFKKTKKTASQKVTFLSPEESYIENYIQDIAQISKDYVPHIITTILPPLIKHFMLIPRSEQEYFRTVSTKLSESIETTCVLIDHIKKIDLETGLSLESSLKNLLESVKIISILANDEEYPLIEKILGIENSEEPIDLNNKKLINTLLKEKYDARKKGKFICETLTELKNGFYGNPLTLLQNPQTQLFVFALFQLPEMKHSQLIFYKALKEKYYHSSDSMKEKIDKIKENLEEYDKISQ